MALCKTERGRWAAKYSGLLAVTAAAAAVFGSDSVGFSQVNTPVAISGFNGYEIYGGTNSNEQTTQDFDAYSAFTFYYNNAPYAPANTGLPTASFTSLVNPNTTFQLAPNTGVANGFELNTAGNAENGPLGNVANPMLTTGTINFTTPQAYTTLALLNGDANGASTITYTLNFTNGTSTSGSFAGLDWFGSNGALENNLGRVYAPYEYLTQYGATYTTPPNSQYVYYNYSGTQPDLYEDDITVPSNDVTLPISSISFSMSSSGGSQWNLFAVSGDVTSTNAVYVYTGAGSNSFGGSTANFNCSGGATAFVNGNEALFDDTATGSPLVSVAAGGVNPSSTVFNNSNTSYVVSGPGSIAGTGTLTVSGGGFVTLTNSNTYTGFTLVQNGTLTIGAGGSIASPSVVVLSGGTLNLNAAAGSLATGALTSSTLSVTDNGTINVLGNATLGTLGGTGTLNVPNPGTAVTLTGGTFAGTYSGNGSTLILGGAGGTIGAHITDGSSANSVVVNTTGSWTFPISNTYSGGTNLSAGVAVLASSQPLGTGPVLLAGGTIGSTYAAGAVIPGVVSGGALVIANVGAGTVELSGNNTFTGPITITGTSGNNSAGTLKIDSPAALGASTLITVQSGASFQVNDGSGNAGLGTTAVISGTGLTVTDTTTGNTGPSGALQGAPGQSDIWAGNVNLSGSAYVAAGGNGLLTLTGSITGTGPLVLTASASQPNGNGSILIIAPSTGNSNTYTGETQILPGPTSTTVGQFVELGANNAFSTNSGIDILSGPAQPAQLLTVDLYSFNQSTPYVTGSNQTGYVITNSQSPVSTLTITSGLRGGAPAFLSTSIQGNVALVMNDPTGVGNQVITGNNSYTGGTSISKGTLTAGSANALGTGPVLLNGGVLSLTVPGAPAALTPIVTPTSFTSSTVTLNSGGGGSPTISGNTLQLTTNGTSSTASSAFYNTKVPVSDATGFTVSFNYNVSAGYADGVSFVMQNDPRGASAVSIGAGGSLGYGGGDQITKSVAVAFEIYPYSFSFDGAGTGIGINGVLPGSGGLPNYISTAPVNIGTSNQNGNVNLDNPSPINVTLVYNGPAETLTESLYNTVEGTSFSTTYTGIDYSSILGGTPGGSTTAYLGFTGGTGGASATQLISNFSYAQNQTYSTAALGSPSSISNAINAAAGTTSSIQIGVSSSNNSAGAVGAISLANASTVALTVPNGIRGVLFTPSVSVASNASGVFLGKLDIGFNDLVVTSSNLSTVTALVASGFSNGKWTGEGIASRAAAANTSHLTALGVILNDSNQAGGGSILYGTGGGISSTLDGAVPALDNVLVKYTYYGDATLDGQVDGSDYSRIDNGFLNGLTGWYNGDFNYDGVIDGSDYTLIDNAYNTQGANLAAEVASPTAQIAGGASAVPEPTSLAMLGVAATGLLSRRRRQIG